MIYTIGYEGRTADEVFALLRKHRVDLLLDVRLRPNSRKPGLAKTALSQSCTANGLLYEHNRELGTPAEMLKQVRETGVYDWPGYSAFLDQQVDALQWARELVTHHHTALLCFEADHRDCHRMIVADRLTEPGMPSIIHL